MYGEAYYLDYTDKGKCDIEVESNDDAKLKCDLEHSHSPRAECQWQGATAGLEGNGDEKGNLKTDGFCMGLLTGFALCGPHEFCIGGVGKFQKS